MNVLFLGGLFPNELQQEIKINSKGLIQNAANNLQWSIVKGLDYYYRNLKIITIPYIGSFPLNYKKPQINDLSFSHIKGAKDQSVGFLNLPLINLFSRFINCKREIENWRKSINGNKQILIYSIHTPFLKAAVEQKKKDPKLNICLIVTDLPEYMSGSSKIVYRFLKNIDSKIINKLLKDVDSFVLLTDFMAEALNIKQKPWIRIESIFDSSLNSELIEKEELKTIMYSGTLARRYGISNLIDAFSSIKSENYRLWICGDGDSRGLIENSAKKDKRIIFYGQRTHEEVLVLQKKATVLINPRTSEGEFTKYSFPSKIMEYLASGTPTIIHRLPGVPDEYFQYCFVAEKENAQGLQKMVSYVCDKKQDELNEFGNKARQFILKNKNPVFQVKKLYDMLNNIN